MQAVSRPYALAAAALVATGAVIATPLLAHQISPGVRAMETKLVDVGVENIIPNLFNDIVNLPAYYLQDGGGLSSVADSFLYTGTWWVPSSTNIWGIDPGDPTHIALIDNFIPFQAFTQGFTDADGLYHPGLNYEFAGLLAAELPNSGSCDAMSCAPMTPPDVITGSTQFDRDIGFFNALMGTATDAEGHENGLFTQFFQVPLQNLIDGYKFVPPPFETPTTGTPTYDPGVINPAGPVNDDWGNFLGWGASGNPFENGTSVVDLPGYGEVDMNPWYNLPDGFHFNLFTPFQTAYESLLQDPASNPIQALTFEGVTHNFENLVAGLIIDFDPYTMGSPACPATCDLPDGFQIRDIIADMAAADPTNDTLSQWVTRFDLDPTLVNDPTQDQINASVALLQTGIYNLSLDKVNDVNEALAAINPALPEFMTHAGVYTDPNYLLYLTNPDDPSLYNAAGQLVGEYGGYNPLATLNDYYALFTNPTDFNALTNVNLLWFLADPLTGTCPADVCTDAAPMAATAAAESANVFGNVDLTALTTDLTNMLAGFGTSAGAEAFNQLGVDFGAEFANLLPSLATSF